ncbi:MAG: hypothetical protein ACR2O6_12155 [Ilumatobacteraceae bacterium]
MKSWWKAAGTYPVTWAAVAILAAILWLTVTWIDPSGPFLVVFIILAIIAAVVWPLTMSATGKLTELQFPIPTVEELDPAELDELRAELEAIEDPQPAEQLQALLNKRESLTKVLESRLDAGELTYGRYLSTSQDVVAAALDNLHEVAVAHASISSIDEGYLDRRLAELDSAGADANHGIDERASLESRRELRRTQTEKIERLLAQNEAALTALDRTTTALADAPIGKTPADAERAMEALGELAARAKKYAES